MMAPSESMSTSSHFQHSLAHPLGFVPAAQETTDGYGQEMVESLGQMEQTKLLFKCKMVEMQRHRLREMLWVVRAEVGIMLRLAERLEAKVREVIVVHRDGSEEEDCVMKDGSAVSPCFLDAPRAN